MSTYPIPDPVDACLLPWGLVSYQLETEIKKILDRDFSLRAHADDYDFWDVRTQGKNITVGELTELLDAVSADNKARKEALPDDDSPDANCFGVELDRLLLSRASDLTWSEELATDDGLWLIGISSTALHPYSKSGLLRKLDREMLMTKDDVLSYLRDNGCTDNTLSDLREIYFDRFGNELCWRYPISDGLHLGTFILVVQEGYLSIPYDSIDRELGELLLPEHAALYDADSLSIFLSDWKLFSDDLSDALREMRSTLEVKAC